MSNYDPAIAEIPALFHALKQNEKLVGSSSADARIAKIQSIVSYLKENEQKAQDALYADLKKPPIATTGEMVMIKSDADYISANLSEWLEPQHVEESILSKGRKSFYIYESKGTILVISPWNAPLACTLIPLIGIIAAGNTAIVKPSEMAHHSAIFLKEIIETLFDANEIAVCMGDKETSTALLQLPFNHIYFTGGPAIGKVVMKAAAEHLSGVTLELGGKNATIVDETADLEASAAKIGWGKCANAGQACVSPDYMLIQESVKDSFIQHLVNALHQMHDPNDQGAQHSEALARIVNTHHFDRIVGLIEDALTKGAKVETGNYHDRETLFIAPTVLSNVYDSMKIMQEEIFGPVLPILSYSTIEEAVNYIGQKEKPLSLYIFSRDEEKKQYFIQNTTSGNSAINHCMIQAGTNPHLPFGGVNNSGMGRSVGKATFTSFANQRTFVEQPEGDGDLYKMVMPPLGDDYKQMLGYLFHHM